MEVHRRLGRPVVPEVKASRATSSAAVSTASNAALARAGSSGRPVRRRTGRRAARGRRRRSLDEAGGRIARGRSRASRRSAVSSPARSSGIVVTATAPALSTASQQATSHGVVRPAQQHPVARHEAGSSTGRGDLVGAARAARRRSRSRPARAQAGPIRPERSMTSSSSSIAQLSRSGYCSSGRSKSAPATVSRGGRLSRQKVSTCADGSGCHRSQVIQSSRQYRLS